MLDFYYGRSKALDVYLPSEPFSISPYPWRSAQRLPAAVIDDELWLIGPADRPAIPDDSLQGTLDLYEAATNDRNFFLLPILLTGGHGDSWAESIQEAVESALDNWALLLPSQEEPIFDRHYGYPLPDPITSWPTGTDFTAVIERSFANRFLTTGHDKRAKAMRALITACCLPKGPNHVKSCPRCRRLYCE
mgnify:CR=1 FL=1